MSAASYQEFVAWQKAMDLVEDVYRATSCFPREEIYGLTGQLRRSAVSIPSNIAEGQGRQTSPDFRKFLSIAYGSLCELETQLIIAGRLSYLDEQTSRGLNAACAEVGRLLNGLFRSLPKRKP